MYRLILAARVREFIMKKIVIIVVILAALTFGVLNYHFILMDNSVKLLKKTDLTYKNTFVDARGAKKYKLVLNPALMKAGIRDLLEEEGVSIGK
jgi:uncharacterized protein YxeA